jgi:hypothetical protein
MILSFPSWLRVLSKASLALAVFSMIGGQWTLFQAVAYGRMVYNYSSHSSVKVAIEKTFSGKYPCPLCKKISMERKRTTMHDPSFEKNTKKWDLILDSVSILEDPTCTSMYYPAFHNSEYADLIMEVPTPPPNL